MKTKNIFTFTVMLICFSSAVSAADIYLSNAGLDTNTGVSGSPVKTLSKALSIAAANDVIHVMNFIDMTAEPSKAGARGDIALNGTSTYTTGGVTYNTWNVGGTLGIIALSKALTIIGDDKATCGFDGKNATCLIRQDGTTTAILISYENLTFKNGKSADASGGGGMYIRSAKASFTNCEFTSNASGGASNINPGGAATIITSIVTINSTRFASNIAKFGSGINAQSGTITLDGCTIENNDASGVGSSAGAGIYASIVSGGALLNMDVKNTLFKNNKAASSGGAFYYTDAAAFASILKFTNCAFISNQVTTNYGGGAFIDNKTASSTLNLSFINTTFYDNLVGGTSGGALFVNSALTGSTINLTNCTVTGNKVTGATGSAGAAIRMLSTTLNSTRKIYNCIIENNVGTTEDMSILNNYTDFAVQGDSYTAGSTLIIDKSFIARCTNANFSSQFGSANTVNYAAVTSGSINNSFRAQFGTFNSTGNYFPLQSTSPAIGYGTTSYLTSLSPTVTTDQMGYTRPSPCSAGSVEVKTVTVSSNSNLSTLGTTSATEVTVTGNELTIDQTSTLRSITIAPGAKTTLNSGSTLTTGSFTLQSNATNGTATFVDANTTNSLTVTGTASVQQWLTGKTGTSTRGLWYLSSPVSAATAAVFDVAAGTNKMTRYDETSHGYITQFSDNATALPPGVGYVAQIGGVDAAYTFSTSTGSNTTKLNSGAMPITVTRTGTTAGKRGFNLVGNPYPSYLDWKHASNTKTNLRSTVWYRVYTGIQMTFDTYDGTTGTGNGEKGAVSQYIPPMQAFWVKVDKDGDNATLSFANAARLHRDQSVAVNSLRAPAQKTTEPQILRLRVSNGTNSDEAILVADANATDALDNYDAEKMSNDNAAIPEIYTLAGSQELVINHLNDFAINKQVALGFRPGTTSMFSIVANELSNVDAQTKVILIDKLQNNAEFDLTNGTAYTFSADATPTTDRFVIAFRAPGVATNLSNANTVNMFVYKNVNNQITINRNSAEEGIVTVCNAIGQKLMCTPTTGTSTAIVKPFGSGVYFVTVSAAGSKSTQKVIIN